MQPEGLSLHSQQPATCPNPEPDQSTPCLPIQLLKDPFEFNVHGSVHRNNIPVYNSNKTHKSQSLFNLTTALHVSGVTITHLQEHKTTVTTASGNRYTVIDRVKFTDKEYRYARLKLQLINLLAPEFYI
jgi:hypothetical protein